MVAAVRIGAGAAFALLAVAGVFLAVLITLDYATIAGLSQSLGAGVDGGIALVVAQLAFLPNLVVWLAAWMLGPGFALGTGTAVAPGGTLLGPVPGIPLLGALPGAAPLFGVLWLLVPVLAAFVGAWLVQGERRDGWPGAGPARVTVRFRGGTRSRSGLGLRSWPGSCWGARLVVGRRGGAGAARRCRSRGGRWPRRCRDCRHRLDRGRIAARVQANRPTADLRMTASGRDGGR